jgi:FG-GAP-like repeat
LNDDSIPDLVSIDTTARTISVRLDLGDGTFGDRQTYSTSWYPTDIRLADMNQDGRLDVLLTHRFDNRASIFLNQGNGALTISSGITNIYPDSLAIGDINGDGRLDIVTGNGSENSVSVLLQNTDGTFSSPTNYSIGGYVDSVALGDIDRDGRLDIVATNHDTNSVAILVNQGNNQFAAPVNYAIGSTLRKVVLGDINQDQWLDIVVANIGSGTAFDYNDAITVLLNQQNGQFGTRTDYKLATNISNIALQDLNRDGRLDLIATSRDDNKVTR